MYTLVDFDIDIDTLWHSMERDQKFYSKSLESTRKVGTYFNHCAGNARSEVFLG